MTQPLRVIDTEFNLLAEIDNYSSLQWKRRWHQPGGFELHLSPSTQGAERLQKGHLVLLREEAGIILHREIILQRDGTEQLIVTGRGLASVLGRRITVPPTGQAYDRLTAAAETIMKRYVRSNCTEPEDAGRVIDLLTIAPDQERGGSLTYQTRYKQLDDELQKLSNASGLGWDVRLDMASLRWEFDVQEGRDLTAGQTVLPPVIFSVDFDAVRSQSYTDSDIGYRNQAYVGGQGEGANRVVVEVGEGRAGLERIETFVDARDLEDEADLPERGQQKLLEMQRLTSFETEIMPRGPYVYREDWDLGDVVTVQNKRWGVSVDARVAEVLEVYEPGGMRLDVTFGTALPTLVDRLRQAVDTPLVEHQEVPTKTSELENDAGFITEASIPSATTYVHTQTAPAAVWTITHNLDRYPSVVVVDSAGMVVMGDVQYQSKDVIQVAFTAPFAGVAYLN